MGADGGERLRKRRLDVDRVDRDVHGGEARVPEPVDDLRPHESPVRRKIDEEPLLGGVVRDLVDEIGTEQGLAAHQGQYAISHRLQPVDRPFRGLLGHPLHGVVVGPAVVAIEVALIVREEIRDDRPELLPILERARSEVGLRPGVPHPTGVHSLVLEERPVVLVGVRPLRINRHGQDVPGRGLRSRGARRCAGRALHQHIVKLSVDSKLRRRSTVRRAWWLGPATQASPLLSLPATENHLRISWYASLDQGLQKSSNREGFFTKEKKNSFCYDVAFDQEVAPWIPSRESQSVRRCFPISRSS